MDLFDLTGRTAVVTGGTRGIGMMMARGLLQTGPVEAAATDDDPARIVNVGGIDGLTVPVGPTCAHSASKAALHHLTRHAVIPVDGGLATSR
ncbi:hypothetical protein MXD59_01850 [Frankia sp. Ag45/Mut15]|uniref:Short-chain dehydrogenase/reductase SDR n=1 Tax=Frankia umida TaxID=573489 RepID=A0ABT0JSJ2_9ACTN|nr:hypothetical protein [Frankia umida]MCK9874535.1 hypothetical protein [Frankia umida]